METLFVNQYYRTEEVEKEVYKALVLRNVSLYVFLGLAVLLSIFSYLIHSPFLTFFLMFIPIFSLLMFFAYRKNLKASCRRIEELFGHNPLIYIEIAADQIRTFAPKGDRSEVNYYQLKKVIQTKNLVLLQTNANLVHILHKQGFSPASCEDFLQLLRSKGLKVK